MFSPETYALAKKYADEHGGEDVNVDALESNTDIQEDLLEDVPGADDVKKNSVTD